MKIKLSVLMVTVAAMPGCLGASEQSAAAESPARTSVAGRMTHENLYLSEDVLPSRSIVTLLSHGGLAQRFVETGAYDVSLYSHGFKFFYGSPGCRFCAPLGVVSAVDIENYVGDGPFWVGLKNIGGGFAVHRHVRNAGPAVPLASRAWPESVTIHDHLVTKLLSPQWALGATFGGAAGALDTMIGCEPYLVLLNGVDAPTVHVRLAYESCMHTPPLRYKKMSIRLLGGLAASYAFSARSSEWGVSIAPGNIMGGLIGFQAAWSFARFGSAYGYVVDSGGTCTVVAKNTYESRLRAHVQHEEALREVLTRAGGSGGVLPAASGESPLRVSPQARTHSLTSYLAFAVAPHWTFGLSGMYSWKQDTGEKGRDIRLVLSYKI